MDQWIKVTEQHYINLARVDKVRFMQEGGRLTATIWYTFGDQSEMFEGQEAVAIKGILDRDGVMPPDQFEDELPSLPGTDNFGLSSQDRRY